MLKSGNLALLSVCLIYLPLLPVPGESQPVIAMIYFLIYMKNATKSFSWPTVNIIPSLIAAFMFTISLYGAMGFYEYGGDALLTMVKYLLPLCFFLVLYQSDTNIDKSVLNFLVFLHVAILALILAGQGTLLLKLFGRYSFLGGPGSGSTGISYLATEPSYTGQYILCILLAIYRSTRMEKKTAYYIFFIAILITTKSVMSIAVLALFMLFVGSARIFLTFCSAIVMIYILIKPEGIRVFDFINVLSRLKTDDIIASFVLLEPSASMRLLKNIPAMYYGVKSIFGYGIGSFGSEMSFILMNMELTKSHALLKEVYFSGGEVKPDSYVASVIFEMGFSAVVLFLLPMLLLAKQTRKNKKHLIMAISILVIFSLQSIISNPSLFYCLVLLTHATKNLSKQDLLRAYVAMGNNIPQNACKGLKV